MTTFRERSATTATASGNVKKLHRNEHSVRPFAHAPPSPTFALHHGSLRCLDGGRFKIEYHINFLMTLIFKKRTSKEGLSRFQVFFSGSCEGRNRFGNPGRKRCPLRNSGVIFQATHACARMCQDHLGRDRALHLRLLSERRAAA